MATPAATPAAGHAVGAAHGGPSGRQFMEDGVKAAKRFSQYAPVVGTTSLKAIQSWTGIKWRPPLSRMTTCALCDTKAAYWCVECQRLTCPGCTARSHHPGSKTTKHSIEEIDWDGEAGAQVFGPLLGNLMLFVGLAFFLQGALRKYDANYMSTANICPTVRFFSNWMASFDTKVFYYWKGDLANFCSMEDSFFRLFIDGWVRNVVTDTDDTLLVIITSWKAVVVSQVVRIFLVPMVAVGYALSTRLGVFIDPLLTQSLSPDLIQKLEDFLELWQPLKRVGPPLTKWRRRPDINTLEKFQYLQGRLTRDLYYHYENAAKSLDYYLYIAVTYAVLLRLACIWSTDLTGFRAGGLFRAILHPVMGNTIAQHREWFGASAPDTFTDETIFHFGWTFMRSFLAFESQVVPTSIHWLGVKLGVIVLLALGARSLVIYLVWGVYLKRETDEFEANWKAPGDWAPIPGGTRMKDCIGACTGKSCSCECCQYWTSGPLGLTVAETN